MAAPAFFDLQQEADRISREVPRIARGAGTFRELQEQAAATRRRWIETSGQLIRACDRLIDALEGAAGKYAVEHPEILPAVKRDRQEAFKELCALDPEHEWFWTEEWQAGERAVDRDIAAGVPSESGTPEEFLAALSAISARKE
jgi:hypothetical protein